MLFDIVYPNLTTLQTDLKLTNPKIFAKNNNIDLTNKVTVKTMDYLNKCVTTLPVSIPEELTRIRQGSPAKSITVLSPRKSPTKAPLRELPMKGSPQKRRLVELDDDDLPPSPQTPSKRPRLDMTLDIPTSPRKSILASPRKLAPTSPKKTVQFPDFRLSQGEPRTPQKNRQVTVDPSPSRRQRPLDLIMDIPEEEEKQRERRFRPVFLDHEQWVARDPEMGEMLKRGQTLVKKLQMKFGDPFAELRPSATTTV